MSRDDLQQLSADRQQTCPAHLMRNGSFVDENSDDDAPFRLRLWLGRVFALPDEITIINALTLRAKQRRLERDLEAILSADRLSADPRSSG